MTDAFEAVGRTIKAVHGLKEIKLDPDFEVGLSELLRRQYSQNAQMLELYGRFVSGEGSFDRLMRRILLRAMVRRLGHGVMVSSGVCFDHPETFEIGNGVFIGAQAHLQGRFDGKLSIGDHVWIGPQSFFDARDLVLEEYVGWGPGAKVLGSLHTGSPTEIPIIKTDLQIKPVRICAWADIGTNAVILPGVTVGKGAVVGAGAVVTKDIPPFAVVAGVPAEFLHWRDGAQSGNIPNA